jgi:integrase/recombinase XerD
MNGGYRVKSNKHPRLKWVVRGKELGKWTRKYFETRGASETYAEIKNTELLNLGRQGAELPIELRLMALESQRRLTDFGKTIREAVDFYIAHLLQAKQTITVREVADEAINAKLTNGIKESTLKVYRHRVKQFCADFGGSDINALSSEKIEKWLIKSFSHPVTRNNNRRVLVNLFNFAKSKKYLGGNPVVEIALAKETTKEVGILRPEQVAELLAHSRPEILPYFAIGAFAGIRPEELLKLEWSDIKRQQGIIRVRATVSKVGKARNVMIENNLREWLNPYGHAQGKICPSSWRRLFRETRINAGITDWPSDCLRHSFATYWLEKYKDAPRLALEMGNSVAVIMDHYHKVLDNPVDAARYWSLMPRAEIQKVVAFTA